jgi:ketosteroid isomerase-like protein
MLSSSLSFALSFFALPLAFLKTGMVPQSGSAGADPAAMAEQLRLAMVNPDAATLARLFSDDLSYGHSNAKMDTKASITADLLSGASDFVTIAISEQSVKTLGDVATVRHTLVADTNDGGKPGHVRLHVLQVWQVQGGRWQLVARQAVRLA